MDNWEYKIFDHKWNNLKRWVEKCEEEMGKEGLIQVGRMGDMMRTIQAMSDKTDEIVLDVVKDIVRK